MNTRLIKNVDSVKATLYMTFSAILAMLYQFLLLLIALIIQDNNASNLVNR